MAFQRFQLWGLPIWGGGKNDIENISNICSSNSKTDYSNFIGVREIESVNFPFKGSTKMASSSSSSSPRKIKKKWQSREERRLNRENDDGVVVPSDGVCLSGSESEGSDWSIGWLEPHGPDFFSDDETDDSFAVLVPCYRNDRRGKGPIVGPNGQFLDTIKNLTSDPFAEGKNLMDQWLSSLQNF